MLLLVLLPVTVVLLPLLFIIDALSGHSNHVTEYLEWTERQWKDK
jgi:hypothetical protein